MHPSNTMTRHVFSQSLLWLGALSGALWLAACKGKNADAAAANREEPPVSVQTEAVQVIDVPRTLRLTGTLKGDRETDLAANANGRIISTSVERGEQIKPGQILAKLDTRAAALSAGPLRAAAEAHRAWLARLTAGHQLLGREVTVVVSGPDAEAATRAAGQVEAFCAQIGADARRLDRAALAERIRFGLDPFGTADAAFGSWSR